MGMPSAEALRDLSVRLARQSSLAERWPVITEDDLVAIDPLTGGRDASFAVVRRLAQIGQLERVRRGTYVMRDQTGVLRIDLLSLIDATTSAPYLITAGRALAAHDLSDQHSAPPWCSSRALADRSTGAATASATRSLSPIASGAPELQLDHSSRRRSARSSTASPIPAGE
jgi:hypothetical protein